MNVLDAIMFYIGGVLWRSQLTNTGVVGKQSVERIWWDMYSGHTIFENTQGKQRHVDNGRCLRKQSISEYIRIRQNISEFVRIYQNILGHVNAEVKYVS